MNESMFDDIPQVSPEENNILTFPCSEEEIRKTVFQIKHNKASGPHSFPAEFFQDLLEHN
jgi:hypothetical protein